MLLHALVRGRSGEHWLRPFAPNGATLRGRGQASAILGGRRAAPLAAFPPAPCATATPDRAPGSRPPSRSSARLAAPLPRCPSPRSPEAPLTLPGIFWAEPGGHARTDDQEGATRAARRGRGGRQGRLEGEGGLLTGDAWPRAPSPEAPGCLPRGQAPASALAGPGEEHTHTHTHTHTHHACIRRLCAVGVPLCVHLSTSECN